MGKHDDELHLHVYDEDVVGRDSVGSAKIDLTKHDFSRSPYDAWVKLPTMLGLRSKGELHVIITHHVSNLLVFLNLIMVFVLYFSHEVRHHQETFINVLFYSYL